MVYQLTLFNLIGILTVCSLVLDLVLELIKHRQRSPIDIKYPIFSADKLIAIVFLLPMDLMVQIIGKDSLMMKHLIFFVILMIPCAFYSLNKGLAFLKSKRLVRK